VRVAALDQGTNTTRLLVADVTDGRVEEVVRRTAITRLGEGVDRRKRLLPLPIARVRNVLTDYRRELEALGSERTLLIATSAVRDAENGEAFLGEIEWSYGFATRLLSGDEEADLTLRGVGNVDDETVVLDVGGGSTELVMRGYRTSVDIGSVRLTERFLHTDPPTHEELDACRAFARAELPKDVRATRVIGVAGTVTSIAALDLGLDEYDHDRIHGHVLTKKALKKQLGRLASMTEAQRREILLEPDRAPVIVAGAVIVREALRALDVTELRVSEHDILDGAALAAAELPEPEEGAAPPGAYTCC
jgi:exopolyphosphatase / guanosine-5'-triphosphate,3'-diphosphate pyrophosphatase